MKPARSIAYLVGFLSALTIAANLTVAFKMTPFSQIEKSYQVEDILVGSKWIASAPIVLASNFNDVSVKNVGIRTENGFGFSDQILSVWGNGKVDTANDPIDLRNSAALNELLLNTKYETDTYCREYLRDCTLALVWDATAKPAGAEFIGVRVSDSGYALVEAGLLKKFGGVNR